MEFGRYHSASEIVREALRLLEERDQVQSAQLAELNQELGRWLDSLDRGERIDPVEARNKVERKSQAPKVKRVSSYVLGRGVDPGLEEIWEYIAADNVEAVDRWIATRLKCWDRVLK